MAKLYNYYVLCPLIDQKSFLGISEDKESECVIVTLSRNVINKYRLVDQKQISGWTSKDHITSAVIYDEDQDIYAGVFNNNVVKLWNEENCNLDKLKKYKFSLNIFKLLKRQNKPALLIFTNGICASLPYAIKNRKTSEGNSIVKESETIVDVASYTINNTDYICYVLKNKHDYYEIVKCQLKDDLGDLERSKLNKIKILRNEDVFVVGVLVNADENCTVYVLWNDSKITAYDLETKKWKILGSAPWISTELQASMAWLGKNHLIIYGNHKEQDGSLLVAFNTLLGIASTKYPMKLYPESAKLYCFNERIILEATNHIGILPFVLETKRNIASLLGTHDIVEQEVMEIATWNSSSSNPLLNENYESEILVTQGLSERIICAHRLPPLLEKGDVQLVTNALKHYTDIPESVLVLILKFVLKAINISQIDLLDREKSIDFCSKIDSDKFRLLNITLKISFCDALLIPHLRNHMSLEEGLFLMRYLSYLVINCDVVIDFDSESKLFDWFEIILDAFYQQILITKDEKVTNVLNDTTNTVSSLLKQIDIIDSTLPCLNKLLFGKFDNKLEKVSPYSIELLNI